MDKNQLDAKQTLSHSLFDTKEKIDLYKKVIASFSFKDSFNSIIKHTVNEYHDNVEALKIVKKFIKSKTGDNDTITDVELENLINQLKDNFKIFFFIAVGITPGSMITLPVLIKIAQKLHIDLKITRTFNSDEE